MEANTVTVYVVIVLWAIAEVCSLSTTMSSYGSNETIAESFHKIRDILIDRLNSRLRVPPKYYRKPTPIMLQYEPFQIITVDEVFQSITVSCTVTLTWRDHNIWWDPKDFHSIKRFELPTGLFWTPTVLLPKTTLKTAINLQMPAALDTSFDGYVTAVIPGFTNTLCHLNMATFPFDIHNCTIIFLERDTYNITHQILPSRGLTKSLGTNGAWILMDSGCSSTKTHSYNPRFFYVTCYVQIRRQSAFFVANLIVPVVLTSLMTLMVFWIPAETEEKVSFLVSMFTSSSVFLNYMIDMIPRSMEKLPQLNLLVFAIEVQIFLATAATAIVLRKYKQEHHKHIQRSVLRTWFQRLRGKDQHKIQTLNVRPLHSENRFPKTKSSFFLPHTNIVHPERESTSHVPRLYNLGNSELSSDRVSEKDFHNMTLFSVNGEVQQSRLDTPFQEDDYPSTCMGYHSFTHDELDKIFFVLLLLFTLGVYLFALLD